MSKRYVSFPKDYCFTSYYPLNKLKVKKKRIMTSGTRSSEWNKRNKTVMIRQVVIAKRVIYTRREASRLRPS